MNHYAFIQPEYDDNDLEYLGKLAAPLSIETETEFAIRRAEHQTWRYQVARSVRWGQWWGGK
jgi:hypothetical protein